MEFLLIQIHSRHCQEKQFCAKLHFLILCPQRFVYNLLNNLNTKYLLKLRNFFELRCKLSSLSSLNKIQFYLWSRVHEVLSEDRLNEGLILR